MQFYSLLYVSRSLLPDLPDDRAVRGIVNGARTRNAELQVTGTLMFTHFHFAQYLEGSRANVDILMKSIARDPRHANLEILESGTLSQRCFSCWDLAYSGSSRFADRQHSEAAAPASAATRSQAAERLMWMMREFCLLA